MQTYFYDLALALTQKIQGDEVILCNFAGETSNFVRFNQARIRQAGDVTQAYFTLALLTQQREVKGKISLSGEFDADLKQLSQLLQDLRSWIPYIPVNPYVNYATSVQNTVHLGENTLSDAASVTEQILQYAQGYDFVGIYAAGTIERGFYNSLQQFNWHSSAHFNVDWSLYHTQDKAVKTSYAGLTWEAGVFESKMCEAVAQLARLKYPPRSIPAGQYRVYLSPVALLELLQLVNYAGFSVRAQRNKYSCLQRMVSEEGAYTLHPSITLSEATGRGIAPAFQSQGFIKPATVPLITEGRYAGALVSPYSAREYGIACNGAEAEESAGSLELAAGTFPRAAVCETLQEGIYINNLWYSNFSDRLACRMTGMTRFATFWVEKGEMVAPLNVMRFDETLYRLLGDKLIALTAERDLILDSSTYQSRSYDSYLMAGALIEDFTFTL